jgi:uncharacterized protein
MENEVLGSGLDRDTRMWAMLCHISAFAGFIGIPFGNILGPLIIWLIKREDHPFINAQGKEALNFQISLIIYGVISGILCLVLIGFLLLLLLWVAGVVLTIIGALKANEGVAYRYPFTIRLL